MSSDAPRARPEIVRAVEEMAQHIAERPFSRDLVHRLDWLVEILISRGYLLPEHRGLIKRDRGDRPMIRLSLHGEKRQVIGSDPGCAERMPICRARCCAMDVELTPEDIEERILKWDLERPYLLRKASHGCCERLGDDGRCGVYEARPAQCRAYDCVDDSRIWIDYAAKIPAPWPWWITPLEEWGLPEEERQARAAARLAPRPAEDGDDADVGEAPGEAPGDGPA